MGTWSAGAVRTRAFIRSAMKRWVSPGIIRSSSATRNQLGRSCHSGRGTGTLMQAAASGRCVAASSACSSGVACWANALLNASSGEPDQAVGVRAERGGFRMVFRPVVDVADGLALVRGERGDVDERRHGLMAGRRDDRAGVGVPGHHDRALDALQRPVERRHVIRQRGQRQWHGDRLDSGRAQARDHLVPARSIGPGGVYQHDDYASGLRHTRFCCSGHEPSIGQPARRHIVKADSITGQSGPAQPAPGCWRAGRTGRRARRG